MTERPHRIQWWHTEHGYRCRVVAGNGKVVHSDEESFTRHSYTVNRQLERFPDAIVEEVDAPA